MGQSRSDVHNCFIGLLAKAGESSGRRALGFLIFQLKHACLPVGRQGFSVFHPLDGTEYAVNCVNTACLGLL